VVHLADGTIAACRFEGVVRSAILALKYGNRRGAAPLLAAVVIQRLGAAVPSSTHVSRSFDVVTWAPTSARRASGRGYDHAELLARHIARQLGLPCRRLLYRAHGDPQTGRTRLERLEGPQFRSRRAARPVRVLLVDDVVTTGATLRAASSALRAAGVAKVTSVAVAATPPTGEQAGRGTPGRLDAA
jgi:predicted amidophosphoribosyltransferase